MWGPEYFGKLAQWHACWCPGSFKSQGISRHGIDPQACSHLHWRWISCQHFKSTSRDDIKCNYIFYSIKYNSASKELTVPAHHLIPPLFACPLTMAYAEHYGRKAFSISFFCKLLFGNFHLCPKVTAKPWTPRLHTSKFIPLYIAYPIQYTHDYIVFCFFVVLVT